MAWDSQLFLEQLEALLVRYGEEGTALQKELGQLYRTAAKEIVDDELSDLAMELSERKAHAAAFRTRLRARWGYALDLFELLLGHCWDIGQGTNEHYRSLAVETQNHRFEALTRLHGKATLTASEILVLLETGHAVGAMARWRTLHEVDVVSAFLYQNSDDIAYRYLRYEDAQTLKMRRAYDRYHQRLGYEPSDPEIDGDPEQLRKALVDEFGHDFLEKNGWAIPVFGKRPTDAEIEEAARLDHYRPYYYLASDAVHATPKGLMATMQQIGDTPMIMAGPSNAGLADPGHGAALSLARCTITLINYCGMDLREDPELDEQVSVLLTTHMLLELADRIGNAFGEAHEQLMEDESLG